MKAAQAEIYPQALKQSLAIEELVLLSTCGRFEAYAVCTGAQSEDLAAAFERRAGRAIRGLLRRMEGPAAIEHLMRVASGLDSWIVGETEILGQVKAAYQNACAARTAGRTCHLAFQRAIYVGKKVRNETRIVGGISSVGGAAALLSKRIFSDIREQSILVFGAGSMAESTVKHLCAKGVRGISVCNRTFSKAQELASRLGGRALDFEEGMRGLGEAGIAVFSTSSDRPVFDAERAAEVSRRRNGKPLFIIDIGVPRNVDPAASKFQGIYLYDIDDLRRIISESLARREDEMLQAGNIVVSERDELCRRLWPSLRPVPAP